MANSVTDHTQLVRPIPHYAYRPYAQQYPPPPQKRPAPQRAVSFGVTRRLRRVLRAEWIASQRSDPCTAPKIVALDRPRTRWTRLAHGFPEEYRCLREIER